MLSQMAKHEPGSLDAVFSALADPTRRAMTERLREGEASLGELAAPSGFALPTILKHLRTLEHAGLVEHYKRGRERRCRLVPGPLEQADAWLAHYREFWADRFAGLSEHLARDGG
jgi:DNA-binding transcriptional ArsR family regulator